MANKSIIYNRIDMSETLKFGNGQWATKVGSTLAYNDEERKLQTITF
jgi:hypothetical protein